MSWALTPTRSRVPIPARSRASTPMNAERMPVAEALRSDEGSSFCSPSLIRPFGVDWTVGGKLAKFGGYLKGNPFQALVDLILHEDLR
jgi:hypothetical protein